MVRRPLVLLCLLFAGLPALAADPARELEAVFLLGGAKDPLKGALAVCVNAPFKELIVADTNQNKIRTYTLQGTPKFTFDVPAPCSVAADAEGNIYVVSQEDAAVSIFDFRGGPVGPLAFPGLPGDDRAPRITRIAIDPEEGALYAIDAARNLLLVTDLDGKYRRHFGALHEGGEHPRFKKLAGFHVAEKRIYAVDIETSRIHVFRKSGALLFSFGIKGGTAGKLARPSAVVVDSRDRILVLDTKRHCISIYDALGEYMGESGGEGRVPGWFYFPRFMTIDKHDTLYICEPFLNRVQAVRIVEQDTE